MSQLLSRQKNVVEVTFDTTHRTESVFNVSSHMPFPALVFASFYQEIQKKKIILEPHFCLPLLYFCGGLVLAPTQVTQSCPSRMGERITRAKAGRQRHLIGEAKLFKHSKIGHSFTTSHWQGDVDPLP